MFAVLMETIDNFLCVFIPNLFPLMAFGHQTQFKRTDQDQDTENWPRQIEVYNVLS